ncbi:MAG: hypothetical protein GQ564_06380 [Bacteroidales bacterium]|nr:hypothetical protein [Bacteroidales bacterium]
MKKLILITSLFLIITQGFAQELTIEEAQKQSRGIIKELFEFRIFMDALKVRQFYDIHRTNTNNKDLQDSIIRFRDVTKKINFSVKGEVDYVHFWVWISNNPDPRTPDGALPELLPAIYTVKFKPTWKTPAPPKDNREYTCKVISNLDQIKNILTLDKTKFDEYVNSAYLDGKNDKTIILRNENVPIFANAGLFKGFDYLEKRIGISPGSVIGIEKYTERFLPNNNDNKFTLSFNLEETVVANIEKVRLEIYKQEGDKKVLLHKTEDITDLKNENSFEWNGLQTENTEADKFITHADNPLYARIVASEGTGGKEFPIEKKFKVKGDLVEVTCLAFFETEDKAKPLKLEYTIDNSNDDVKFVAGKIIITDKNGEAIDNIELKKSGDILETNTVDWDPKKVKAKLKYENTPLNFEFIASTDAEFKDKYTANTTSFLNPLKITTTTSRGDFAPGIENYANNKLKIEYEVKDVASLNSYNPKIQIYNESGETIISTLAGFDKTKKEITWDGKKDDGQFVVDADCDYEIQLQTGENFSIFKGTDNDVNINAEGWRNFRFTGTSPWNDFSTFNSISVNYNNTLTTSGIKPKESERPLEYLEKHLVENVEFFGENIGTGNIYFVYILKLVEKVIKDKNNTVLNDYIISIKKDISLGIRVKKINKGVSNHSLGFGLDINAKKNPQLLAGDVNSHYLYHLIYLVTGSNFYDNRSTIDEMKKVHNDFMGNLKKTSLTNIKTEVINRLNKLSSLSSYEIEVQNEQRVFSFENIVNSMLTEILQSIIDDTPEYTGNNKEEVINILSNQKMRLVFLSSEFYYVEKLMNDLIEAYYYDVRFPNDYNEIKEYLKNIELKIKEMLAELTEYESNLDDPSPTFTIQPSNMDSFKKLNTTIKESNDIIIKNYGNLGAMPGNILLAINNSSDIYGGLIIENGFFDMNTDLVKCFTDNEYISWGGKYKKEHDWMHFEVRPKGSTNLGSDKGQVDLYLDIDSLDDLINKINALGFEQYKWNDSDKKDYIVKK